jgi:cytochrome c biogenesis protein CcmG, thiol:disulfide interchange protein DsbE
MSDLSADHELFDDDLPTPETVPEPPRRPVGIDVLAPPEPDAGPSVGARERIRSSRFGTLVVLLVTAAVVIGGVWLVNRGNAADAAAQTGGGTVIKLPGTSTVPPPEVGKPAQDFQVTTYDGTSVSLSSFKGKPVWLTFGASWCSGCQAEVPDIEAAYKAHASQGVVVLGVNISEDNTAVKAYAARVGLNYPMAADPSSSIADTYAVSAIPAHFFIDANGIVRDIRLGALSPGTMDSILDKLAKS